MRRWLVLLLVLLLPLRGLLGEAMAGEMLAQATHAVAQDCDHHGAGHAHEAHASDHDAADAADTAAAPADCPTCPACQMCSSVAVIPSVHAAASEHLPQAPPSAVPLAFRNAEPTLAFKPPRS